VTHPALRRGASLKNQGETAPKPIGFTFELYHGRTLAIPPRAPARGILAKASEPVGEKLGLRVDHPGAFPWALVAEEYGE
jgi:hypothetical protein